MAIFLAGGGGAEDSLLLDQRFVEGIRVSKPLVYIPVAMERERYPSCLKWFKSVFRPLDISDIQMRTDLGALIQENLDLGGIYIGGGNTGRLLRKIRETGFDSYLREMISKGIPIYGGSAGAIIFGETIMTAPEVEGLDKESAKGLDILNGFSVRCHYKGEDLNPLCRQLETRILAIPERSGLYFNSGNIMVIGYEPLTIFNGERKTSFELGESRSISNLF